MRQMNGGDFRKAFGFLVVGLMGLGASAIDITEDTTVTGADIAAYATADINIADGKTLTLSNPNKSYTFTGALSGSGNFVIKSGSTSWNRMTLNGNASSFTGGIYLTNQIFSVNKPAALGSAKVFVANGSEADWNKFFGGVYTTDMDLNVGIVKLNDKTTDLQGVVKLKPYATVRGPGRFSGTVKCAGYIYAYENPCFAGPVTLTDNGKLSCGSGESLTLAYKLTCGQYYDTCTINFAADEVFAGAMVITTGKVSLNLNGHNQTWNDNCYQNSATVKVATDADKPATLKVSNVWYSTYTFTDLAGAVSLYFDPTGNNKAGSLAGSNSTTGTVSAVNDGVLTLKNGLSFSEKAMLSVSASKWYLPRLKVPASATVTAEKATLTITETNLTTGNAKVEIGASGLLIVREAFVNGAHVKAGDYTASTDASASALSKHMTGTGTIRVLGKPGLIISFR